MTATINVLSGCRRESGRSGKYLGGCVEERVERVRLWERSESLGTAGGSLEAMEVFAAKIYTAVERTCIHIYFGSIFIF